MLDTIKDFIKDVYYHDEPKFKDNIQIRIYTTPTGYLLSVYERNNIVGENDHEVEYSLKHEFSMDDYNQWLIEHDCFKGVDTELIQIMIYLLQVAKQSGFYDIYDLCYDSIIFDQQLLGITVVDKNDRTKIKSFYYPFSEVPLFKDKH